MRFWATHPFEWWGSFAGWRWPSWLALPTSWSRLHAEPLEEDKQLLPSKAIDLVKPCCAHPVLDWPCSGGSAGQLTNSLEHEVGEDGVVTLHLPSEGIKSSRKWTAVTVLPYRKMSSKVWRTCLDLSSRKYHFLFFFFPQVGNHKMRSGLLKSKWRWTCIFIG